MSDLRTQVANDLANLEEGHRELMQKREQIERALEQQSGGIAYARRLLEKIDSEDAERKPASTTVVDGVPAAGDGLVKDGAGWR